MIAGIDGGGTSTKLELRDDNNELIARMTFGPFNITAIGEDAFRARIAEVAAKGRLAECDRLCVGGAGVSSDHVAGIVRETLAQQGFAGKMRLCADYEIALRGAMDGPGCVLIAGTGSVGYGVNASGKSARVGGWGHLIDDAGSGYALGRDALTCAVQTADGRMNAQMLKNAVFAALEAETVRQVVNRVYDPAYGKAGIAALAPVLLACAAQGDAASWAILGRNAAELRQIVTALGVQLGLKQPCVALLGSLIAQPTAYRDAVLRALSGCAKVTEPAHDALWGAAQMAWEMA